MAENKPSSDMASTSTDQEIRLVLVGPPGAGKSATGNTLLGKQAFDENVLASSPDNHCQCAKATIHGKAILVVDTPGMLYSCNSSEDDRKEISREVAKCVLLSSPGPHAILLVIRMTRLSDRLPILTKVIEDIFGSEAKRYIIIVLTGKDDLEYEEEALENYIADVPSNKSNIFKTFPIFTIDNKADSDYKRHQTKELLKVILGRNRTYMSNAIYEGIEGILLRVERELVL